MTDLNYLIRLPSVPTETVHFGVEVDRSRCSEIPQDIESRLVQLESNGFDMSVNDIVSMSAAFFEGGPVHPARGKVHDTAHRETTWDVISNFDPHAGIQPGSGQPK